MLDNYYHESNRMMRSKGKSLHGRGNHFDFWQVHRSQKETENRQQMDEIDACNARIRQLEKQLSMKQENIMLIQANLQSYESKIQRMEQESSNQQSQAELNQRQIHRLNEEIDQLKLNNTGLRLENEYDIVTSIYNQFVASKTDSN